MSRSLGTLTLDLIAKTGGFEAGMDKAARIADKRTGEIQRQATERAKSIEVAFAGMAKSMVMPLAGAAIGLSGIMSLGALKSSIDSAISGFGGLKDAAEKTGASVEHLSALKGVAKIGGRDFAEVETGLVRLNKALHGTDDESKGAGKALAALGLNLQTLRDMDPAEAMLALAKAQDHFADGGGKSAAMMIAQALMLSVVKQGMSALGFPAFANGGVFDGGLQAFASGGVVTRPTAFRFASGGSFKNGVMGEAGPEAILPLQRGANGKLGVSMSGGASGDTVVNITVNQNGSGQTETGSGGAARELANRLAAVVREELVIQQRPGGLLYR